jgi:hypothetical protein
VVLDVSIAYQRKGTDIDYVAGAWTFHLALVASFVPWLAIPHPVHQGSTVVCDGTCEISQSEAHSTKGTTGIWRISIEKHKQVR